MNLSLIKISKVWNVRWPWGPPEEAQVPPGGQGPQFENHCLSSFVPQTRWKQQRSDGCRGDQSCPSPQVETVGSLLWRHVNAACGASVGEQSAVYTTRRVPLNGDAALISLSRFNDSKYVCSISCRREAAADVFGRRLESVVAAMMLRRCCGSRGRCPKRCWSQLLPWLWCESVFVIV